MFWVWPEICFYLVETPHWVLWNDLLTLFICFPHCSPFLLFTLFSHPNSLSLLFSFHLNFPFYFSLTHTLASLSCSFTFLLLSSLPSVLYNPHSSFHLSLSVEPLWLHWYSDSGVCCRGRLLFWHSSRRWNTLLLLLVVSHLTFLFFVNIQIIFS